MKITVDICTRERYNILCDTLFAILNQTYLPDEIIIYDDTPVDKRTDMRTLLVYHHIFCEFDRKKIKWQVIFGNNGGQVKGHQWIKDNAKNDWIWRVDDDEIPESDVLLGLINTIENEKSIVSCCIPHFLHIPEKSEKKNKIDTFKFFNSQWCYRENVIEEAEHLYSSFLYNRKTTIEYTSELSIVGHREETLFTYRNFKHGCDLKINKNFIIWHKRYNSGGIRSSYKQEYFEHDEYIADRIIKNLISWNGKRIFCIEGGIGDNYAFLSAFDNDFSILKNSIVSTSYPEVYSNFGVEIISIQKAKDVMGDRKVEFDNVYHFMLINSWKDSLVNGYKKLFNIGREK